MERGSGTRGRDVREGRVRQVRREKGMGEKMGWGSIASSSQGIDANDYPSYIKN